MDATLNSKHINESKFGNENTQNQIGICEKKMIRRVTIMLPCDPPRVVYFHYKPGNKNHLVVYTLGQ